MKKEELRNLIERELPEVIEVIQELQGTAVKEGITTHCWVCKENLAKWKAIIGSAAAIVLREMVQEYFISGKKYFHGPKIIDDVRIRVKNKDKNKSFSGGGYTSLMYFGLVIQMAHEVKDGPQGKYLLTQKGVDFVTKKEMKIPKALWVRGGRVLGLASDREVTFKQCLGKHFDYYEDAYLPARDGGKILGTQMDMGF